MMQMVHSRFNALLSACVLSLIATAGWSQSLTWLGTLGGSYSQAYGVSPDGRVVVGVATNAAGQSRAFRWQNGVMQDLGTLPGYDASYAYGVSDNGAVVVGVATNAAGQRRAFRWENGVMQDLGTLGGTWSEAYGVSADGRVVVGRATNAAGYSRAFRWENGVMQDLGTLGGNQSGAYAVSADGRVVVGWAEKVGRGHAFRWTASSGRMDDLGTLGAYGSWATGVSADGAVVVGWSLLYNPNEWEYRAFRWTASGGMQQLRTLAGYRDYAYGVSADGSVVVGISYSRAVRWTASGSIEDLTTTYASLLTYGSDLKEARAISPDGRYIVGFGHNFVTRRNEAFLLDTQVTPPCTLNGDVNGDGIVDDADLLIVLFNFGNQCP